MTNYEKRDRYAELNETLRKALEQEFYYEAIFIEHAILEDRVISLFKHANLDMPFQLGAKLEKLKTNQIFKDEYISNYMETYFQDSKIEECIKEYENLFSLMREDVVNISEYEEYQKQSIQYLIDKKIISIDEQGFLQFVNVGTVLILRDLFYNGFSSTIYYKKRDMIKLLEEMEQKGWIYFSNKLLSNQESDYFNYYLNYKIKSDYLFFKLFNLRLNPSNICSKASFVAPLSLIISLTVSIPSCG